MPLMNVQSMYKVIVSQYLVPFLKREGFLKTKGTWFIRWEAGCLWRVSAGFRKSRGRDEGWADVHVCVGFPALFSFLSSCPVINWDIHDPKRPCTMAANIRHLRPSNRTPEWRLLPECDVGLVGMEMVNDIKTYGLAYFDEYGSLEKALHAWESGVWHNLGLSVYYFMAAAYCLRGQQAQAFALIESQIKHYRDLYQATGVPSDRSWMRQLEIFLEFLKQRCAQPTASPGGSGSSPRMSV